MALDPESLARCVAEALNFLLAHRNVKEGKAKETKVHWGDIRSTALAVWAFREFVSGPRADKEMLRDSTLRDITEAIDQTSLWLANKGRPEDDGLSWESEGWDTSLAILALVADKSYEKEVRLGRAWLDAIRDKRRLGFGVWYEEVWETTLATVAFLRFERERRQSGPDISSWLVPILQWFVGIPSKETGEFVCPHYSGFLAWILGEIHLADLAKSIERTEAFLDFSNKTDRAVRFLISKVQESGEEEMANSSLWSAYTFSNAYIGYGLSVLNLHVGNLEPSFAAVLVAWMTRQQNPKSGGFEDIEDTALAVLALSMLVHGENVREEESTWRKIAKHMREMARLNG